MILVEGRYITFKEYEAYKEERLPERNFESGVIYVAMVKLRSNSCNREAAQLPISLNNILHSEDGWPTIAEASFLDRDYRSAISGEGSFTNGYWQDPWRLSLGRTGALAAADVGYILPYVETINEELASWSSKAMPDAA